jgi:hypothetical protein
MGFESSFLHFINCINVPQFLSLIVNRSTTFSSLHYVVKSTRKSIIRVEEWVLPHVLHINIAQRTFYIEEILFYRIFRP